MRGLLILLLALAALLPLRAEPPDISSVAPDLTVPEMTAGAPSPGKRVRDTTPGWKQTAVYHSLYLPTDWKPGGRFPVIVEWTGNGRYTNRFGDECLGRPEDARLGYGIAAGARCIWLSLPYLNNAGTEDVITWWGNAPSYNPEPTLAYCRATVRFVCETWSGDSNRIILAGFSRGAIACNYLGLHDDQTAQLWRAFICYSHYDGVGAWPFPASDRPAALARLQRLRGRPQFICGENTNTEETRLYLKETGLLESGAFTILATGYRNHNDAWALRPGEARDRLRLWLNDVLK
jgi:hypothetical protein